MVTGLSGADLTDECPLRIQEGQPQLNQALIEACRSSNSKEVEVSSRATIP